MQDFVNGDNLASEIYQQSFPDIPKNIKPQGFSETMNEP